LGLVAEGSYANLGRFDKTQKCQLISPF